MTFLHVGLLWLIPLAAIPIALHLLTLHRLKTVELSTFRFLFDSYVQQRRQIKFLEAILAALRTLFLLLLVLVVARPVVKQWSALFGAGAGRDVIMIVDCSASMNARSAGMASIDRARSTALAVAERLSRDDRLTLVRLTSRAEVVFSRFTSDTDAIREKIESLATTPSRANLYTALSDLFGAEAYRKPGQTVYLFTDCQSTAWREVKDQGLGQIVPADTHFLVVNVGSSQPLANHAVVGESPRENRVVVGLPVMLRPKVVNHSKTEAADVTVGVIVNEREIDRVTIGLKPGESASREVVYTPREPGVERCRFEIADDPFPDDDAFLFTLNVVPAIKILVVNGAPSKDPLESEGLFLLTALQSQPERSPSETTPSGTPAAPQLGPGAAFVRSLDVQEIAEPQLTPAVLDGTSAVMLANAGGLNQQQFTMLRDFVISGGGLVIWPGDKINPEVYTKQFFPSPLAQSTPKPAPRPAARRGGSDSAIEPLLDLKMAAPVGDLNQVDQFEKLAPPDYAHPVFSVFDDPKARYLMTARFLRRFPIELGEDRSNTWPLAHFSNGQPAVVESRCGHGIVLCVAFPPSAKWSNLPLKPEFVPLVLRMASYVMRRADIESPSVVAPGNAAEIAVASQWAPVTARITDPGRRTSVITFERYEGRLAGAFENTAERGYYAVEVAGGSAEQPRKGTVQFAVNLSPDESDFAMISQDNLQDWMSGLDVSLIDASAEAQQVLGRIDGSQREIWRPLIWILFAVIAVEFLLSTLGGMRDKDAPTVGERIQNFNPGTLVGRMTGAADRIE
jgi:hypothetical protein